MEKVSQDVHDVGWGKLSVSLDLWEIPTLKFPQANTSH